MKVKIIKNPPAVAWYYDKIGQVFDVTDYDKLHYLVDGVRFILKTHAEIVKVRYKIHKKFGNFFIVKDDVTVAMCTTSEYAKLIKKALQEIADE